MSAAIGALTDARRRRDIAFWLAWGVLVFVAVAYVVWALHVLLDTPRDVSPWWLSGSIALPVAVIGATAPSIRPYGAAVTRFTLAASAVVGMILSVYLVVVIGMGSDLQGTEHRALGLSMVAAVVSVLLAGPLRRRIAVTTETWTKGPTRRASAALETFGTRMTRSVPMDELLLQLAEALHESMATAGAELWVGESGVLDRTISIPDRGDATTHLTGAALGAVTVARVSGATWGSMWVPEIVSGIIGEDRDLRIASITHLGKLLGLIVVVRHAADGSFRPADEVALTDLARTLGLALHNVGLDSALQKSLSELEHRNIELQASRARIVSAGDESRRMIERNLHDGAQQHLVALAIKIRMLEKQFGTADEGLTEAFEQLQGDVQTTIGELRELAHGIYPPLLRDRGLGKALENAASRSPLPITVDATPVRFDADIEAAVYFCCLEAMQNAGKYAGDGARITVTVATDEDRLVFEIVDDGVGFDAGSVAESHGFVNMRDRVGAHGGDLIVESKPGHGTRVAAELPLPPRVR